MKRPLIITICIVILLLVCGVWVYLLAFGTPEKPRDLFTNLGIVSETQEEVRIIEVGQEDGTAVTQLGLTGNNLQQLTTRAVAGFGFASIAENTVRYVERGTGHVYEIDLDTGFETQISLTTLPQTAEAVFSQDASTVAIISYEGYAREVSVGRLIKGEDQLEMERLPLNAENIAFKGDSTVYFSITEDNTTTGYAYHMETKTRTQLFSAGLADLRVYWGADLEEIYVQTKPTQYLEGSLYLVSGNALTPATSAHFGLTAVVDDEFIVSSYIKDEQYVSESVTNGITAKQALIMLEEKCVFDTYDESSVWCAAPLEIVNSAYLEDWYKGAVISEDYLWLTDLHDQSSSLVADFTELSGRVLDVSDIAINETATTLLLSNKTDQSLWMYKLQQ